MNFKLIEKEFAIYITKNEMLKIKEKTKTNEYKLAIKLKKKYSVSDNAVYVLSITLYFFFNLIASLYSFVLVFSLILSISFLVMKCLKSKKKLKQMNINLLL